MQYIKGWKGTTEENTLFCRELNATPKLFFFSFFLATEWMLPEWVMIRKRLELYYHRWQLCRDRQVMLRGKDKRLWHYVWRVKDSQSKLELLLLDQYFSVQHLSWLLVRGFCRYEHWESKIKLKKNDCCCSLTCGLLKLFRSKIHNSFSMGQTPATWEQVENQQVMNERAFSPVLPLTLFRKKVKPPILFLLHAKSCLHFFVPFYFLYFMRQYLPREINTS